MSGRKDGLFGGAGVSKTVLIQELTNNLKPAAWWYFRIHRRWRRTREGTDLFLEMTEVRRY